MPPVQDTPDGKLYAQIVKACPSCKSKSGFYAGPRGGMSQNIFCKNATCRASFNVTRVVGVAEELGPAALDHYEFVRNRYGKTTW
jgi:hypothetical protein